MRHLLGLLILCAGLANIGYTLAADETLTVQPTDIPDWFVMDGRLEPVDQGTVSA